MKTRGFFLFFEFNFFGGFQKDGPSFSLGFSSEKKCLATHVQQTESQLEILILSIVNAITITMSIIINIVFAVGS